jgi:hypothetical protein
MTSIGWAIVAGVLFFMALIFAWSLGRMAAQGDADDSRARRQRRRKYEAARHAESQAEANSRPLGNCSVPKFIEMEKWGGSK